MNSDLYEEMSWLKRELLKLNKELRELRGENNERKEMTPTSVWKQNKHIKVRTRDAALVLKLKRKFNVTWYVTYQDSDTKELGIIGTAYKEVLDFCDNFSAKSGVQ